MTTAGKTGLVLLGYALALVVAFGVTALYVVSTAGPDRDTYAGMYAFGDALLFLFVLGVASLPATGLALYFLRHDRPFWIALSVLAIASLVAFAVFLFAPR